VRLRAAGVALLVLLGGWLLAGVVTAGPAAAHASLVASTPADGAQLDSGPDQVTLQFSERVSLGPGYARVLGSDGQPVATGRPRIGGDVLTIPLRGTLPRGAYVVAYRVVSADSHPVEGAYSFAVGNVPLVSAQSVAAQPPTDTAVAGALPVGRWIGFAGLALSVGIPVLVLACWPTGRRSARLRRLSLWGAGAVAVGAAVGFLLEGPYTAGRGLGSVLDPSLLSSTANSGPGVLLVFRAVFGLVLLVLLARTWRTGDPAGASAGALPDAWTISVGAVLGLGIVGTTAGIGHAAGGSWTWLALLVTAVHVGAMTVWLGGLVGLAVGVLRSGVPVAEMAGVLPRFSRLAFGAVTALVITGIFQAVREVGTPGALFSTEYGWILTAKILVVVVVLGAAAVSRVWVQQHLGGGGRRPDGRRRVTAHAFAAESPDGEAAAVAVAEAGGAGVGLPGRLQQDSATALPAFRRSVLVELVLAVAILALSSVLVGESPASAAPSRPIDVVQPLRGSSGASGSVEISVAPASPGANSLHLFVYDAAGEPTQPAGIQVRLSDADHSVGSLDVPLQPAGPGHYIADAMQIPGTGTWTLTVTVRTDEFTATTASTTFPVR
jgi:copper transport protein